MTKVFVQASFNTGFMTTPVMRALHQRRKDLFLTNDVKERTLENLVKCALNHFFSFLIIAYFYTFPMRTTCNNLRLQSITPRHVGIEEGVFLLPALKIYVT